MDQVVLKDFRCFHEHQTARLAPLTLLVGENSTGKTSFMALIRALWDVAYSHRAPDFKEDPYNLGTFEEIAHYRGNRGGCADTFEAGFDWNETDPDIHGNTTLNRAFDRFSVTFGRRRTVPFPVRRSFTHNDLWIEEHLTEDEVPRFSLGTERGSWIYSCEHNRTYFGVVEPYDLGSLYISLKVDRSTKGKSFRDKIDRLNNSPRITDKDLDQIE